MEDLHDETDERSRWQARIPPSAPEASHEELLVSKELTGGTFKIKEPSLELS